MRWLYGGIEDDGGVEGCRLGNKWSREMEKEEGKEKERRNHLKKKRKKKRKKNRRPTISLLN